MGACNCGRNDFKVGEMCTGSNGRRRTGKIGTVDVARCGAYRTSVSSSFRGARSSREPGIQKPCAAARFRFYVQEGASGMTNQSGCGSLQAGCGKAALVACLMLHLRSRYVSKAAILTTPVLLVLVENRSPA
jgi:hypothetical protein